MNLTIRKVEPGDLANIVSLLQEFAAFEKLSAYCDVTEERLHAAMFGDHAVVEGLIALDDDTPIGHALFFPSFASFRGQLGLYLEDIYVSEKYRGKGVGLSLLKEVARIAASRGFERIDFQVLDWNTPAIEFYKRLGADSDNATRHFKFTDEAFFDLANAEARTK